jgi:diguanylate cyclase (GGDEF)-like protein
MSGMKLEGSNLLVRKEITRLINSRMYLVKFPSNLEQQYSRQYKNEAAREYRVRAVIIMGLYLYLSAGIYQTIPGSEVQSWLMLYGWVGVIVFITWLLSLFKAAAQWFDLYTCIGSSLAIAISFAMTSILDGGGNVLYHAAMMYAVVIIYGFVGMRFYTATIAGWSGGIIGLLITKYFHGQLEWTLLQRTYTFSSFLGMCLAYATDHQHRENYLQSCLIERTRLKMVEQALQLEALSQHDALTGLANRRHLDEIITSEWNRSIRYKTPLTVMMIDIDYFKNYNDTLGHPEGDRCLKVIADCLAKCAARSGDLAARYGGEEFLLLFATTDRDHAEKQAERLVHLIQELAIPHPASPVAKHVTISIGVACTIPQLTESSIELIKKSDTALYKAKISGRNRFVIAD